MPKPRITVYPGMLIATCGECLKECYFEYKVLLKTSIRTPLGMVVIIKVLSKGLALVAGPSTNKEMHEIITLFNALDAKKIFIDGALFRKSIASFNIAEGVILSTGASYHKNINIVVEDTSKLLKQLSLPKLVGDVSSIVEKLHREKAVLINDQNDVSIHKVQSVVGNESLIIDSINKSTKYLYINGGISSSFIRLLVNKRHEIDSLSLILNDATQLIIEPNDLNVLKQINTNVFVLNEIKICAVTYNPYSPFGYEFDGREFYKKLNDVIKYPLINVISDKEVSS